MFTRLFALLIAFALPVAACSSEDEPAPLADNDDTGAVGAQADADLALADSGLGQILVDADGVSLYLFTPDNQGAPTCVDDCAATWPPAGELAAVGEGLDAALLGTTEHPSGTVQATYNGWPLYYFSGDSAAGDTNGQGVGDVWYVIDAAGDAIGA